MPKPRLVLVLLALVAASPSAAQSFRFQGDERPTEAPPAEAPLSLTASDGTGLALVDLSARAVVEGPLAFTELRLTFVNPQPRVIEGRFRVTLPENAALSRFAMKIGERWQEGEVVEKQAARRAYEDFLHRRQDPALLEQAAGNEFTARVFPIPARGKKELIVSYSHALTATGGRYELPLRGLPEVKKLDVRVTGRPDARLQRAGWVPDRDFVVKPKGSVATTLRNGAFVVTEVVPVRSTKEDRVRSLTILLDTSASRALGMPTQVKLVERLAQALARGQGKDTQLRVAVFDQNTELMFDGRAGEYGREASRKILRRRALGASDFERALTWAAKNAKTERLVLVTDGVATAGAVEASALDRALSALANSGVGRVDAIATGGLRDTDMLRTIVTGHARRDGAVIDGDQSIVEVAQRLVRSTRSGMRVEMPGARWVWPEKLDGVQAGDPVLVYAALPKSRTVSVKVDGRTVKTGRAATANRHLLARAVAQAEIARLVAQRADEPSAKRKERLKQQIVELSVETRVMSPFTSLLVLETEQDYARFGIARRGLADILVVNERGLVAQKRSLKNIPKAPPKPRPKPVAKSGKAKKKSASRSRAREGEREAAAPPAEADADSGEDEGLADGAPAPEPKVAESAAPPPPADARPAPQAEEAPRRNRGRRDRPSADRRMESADDEAEPGGGERGRPKKPDADPYEGPFKEVMQLIAKRKAKLAVRRATAWRDEAPGDVMALVALGEAFTASGKPDAAARAYGSIIDLFPGRADLRRFAGQRLEALAGANRSARKSAALELAVDTYEKAREQRPDHPASHHLLAFALQKRGDFARAFDVLKEGLARRYPDGRFAGVRRILQEDLGLIAAAWGAKEPSQKRSLAQRVLAAGGVVEEGPSLRFVLTWETDANDVDFHIYDGKGGHAYYSARQLASGGELYADVTTGYGPECFTIRKGARARAAPYTLQAHYYSRGPMGYGMGKLQIIEHDGQGGLSFQERPFVVMKDGAYLDLGVGEVADAVAHAGAVVQTDAMLALAASVLVAVAVPFPERAEDSRYLDLERLYHDDKPDEGVARARALLKERADDAELYVLLARFLYEVGERHKRDADFDKEALYVEMVALLEKARALRPGDPRIGWGLGVAKARLGTTRGILASLRSAREIEALWLDAANKGARYRSLGGKEELPCDAYLTLGVFYRLLPDWWIIGVVAGTRGDLDKALHWLTRAEKCSPDKIRVLKELAVGQLCVADRRDDSGYAHAGQATLKRLLKLKPRHETDRIDLRHARYCSPTRAQRAATAVTDNRN